MKYLKSLLMVICFLSVFSVAAYGGGGSCYCSQQSPGGSDYHNATVYIPGGTNFSWLVQIEGNNEITYSYVGSSAAIIGGINPYPSLQHREVGAGYYNITDSGSSTSSPSGSVSYLYCGAEVGADNDNGSGATSRAVVSW